MDIQKKMTVSIFNLFAFIRGVLQTPSLWILIGMAGAGYALLFAPPFAGVKLEAFRHDWGPWIWAEAVAFTVLAFVRAVDLVIGGITGNRQTAKANRALVLTPLHNKNQSWWHEAKQPDGRILSQISVAIQAANLTDAPVQIIKAQLVRPKHEMEQSHVLLPARGTNLHSGQHPVPARDTVQASLHIMANGAIAKAGKKTRVTLGLTDQFGTEYLLKNVTLNYT